MFGYVTVNKPEIKFKDFDMSRLPERENPVVPSIR